MPLSLSLTHSLSISVCGLGECEEEEETEESADILPTFLGSKLKLSAQQTLCNLIREIVALNALPTVDNVLTYYLFPPVSVPPISYLFLLPPSVPFHIPDATPNDDDDDDEFGQ